MISRNEKSQAGMTLIEVTLVVLTLAVSLAAVTQSIATGSAARIRLERKAAALEAVRDMVERIRATPIEELEERFGIGGTPGDEFSIPGLDGQTPAGRIILITDETLTDADIGMTLGMPRDLDGDGAADDPDVADEALVLPVIVEARWGSADSPEVLRLPVVVLR